MPKRVIITQHSTLQHSTADDFAFLSCAEIHMRIAHARRSQVFCVVWGHAFCFISTRERIGVE